MGFTCRSPRNFAIELFENDTFVANKYDWMFANNPSSKLSKGR